MPRWQSHFQKEINFIFGSYGSAQWAMSVTQFEAQMSSSVLGQYISTFIHPKTYSHLGLFQFCTFFRVFSYKLRFPVPHFHQICHTVNAMSSIRVTCNPSNSSLKFIYYSTVSRLMSLKNCHPTLASSTKFLLSCRLAENRLRQR